MFKILEKFKSGIWENKGLIVVGALALFLLIPSVFAAQKTQDNSKKEVLGAISTPLPIPSETPLPTIDPTLSPTLTPTQTPTPVPTPTPSSTPAPTSTATATPAPTATPTPSPSVSPTPSPMPVGLSVQVGIDYAGQRPADSYTTTVTPGQTAWDAVVAAVGAGNIVYDHYDFGNFITSFNGISADPNSQYYEFRVNGVSSDVGVSDYTVNDGDKLDFVLTSF